MANPVPSGSATFLVSRDDVITATLQRLKVVSIGGTAGTSDITLCALALNLLLKNLAMGGYLQWLYKTTAIPFVAGQATYTIAESGANVTDFRPVRISHGWRRDGSSPPIDTPLIGPISRMDYDMLTPKLATGIPNSFMYDPQVGTLASVTYWPAPLDATNTGYIAMQRPVQDILSSGQNFDLPQEWYLPLVWILADEVSPAYEVDLPTIKMIEERATKWRAKIEDFTQEDAPSRFIPDMSGSYGSFES